MTVIEMIEGYEKKGERKKCFEGLKLAGSYISESVKSYLATSLDVAWILS